MSETTETAEIAETPKATEVVETAEVVIRKSWDFGHFGTRHDGEVWSLVRIIDADGWRNYSEPVVATNTSATPLVALARAMNRVEKRALRLEKLLMQRAALNSKIWTMEEEIRAEEEVAACQEELVDAATEV